MTDKIKQIIKAISQSSPYNVQMLGDFVQNILCVENEMAIYIKDTTNDVILLVSTNGDYNANYQTAFYMINELMAVIEKLEGEGLIYIQEGNNSDALIYEKANLNCLEQNDSGVYQYIENHQVIFRGQPLIYLNTNKIIRYIQSFIYPTQGLIDFVAHEYMSENEYKSYLSLETSKKSFGISLLAIVVSLVISVGSIIGTTHYNNKHGYSTICPEQYDTLLLHIEKQKTIVVKDTIVMESKSTSVKNSKAQK